MSFHSINFWTIYLLSVPTYWLIPDKYRNKLLLVLSCFFYGYFDYRFFLLLVMSTTIDYLVGFFVSKENKETHRKLGVTISFCSNLLFLITFKYFSKSLAPLFLPQAHPILHYVFSMGLPIGISFYTFQKISYVLDVYRGHTRVCRNFLDFALYVIFFPQLIAGPIERSKKLLPQIVKAKIFSYNECGLGFYLILLGLTKKLFMSELVKYPMEALVYDPQKNLWLFLLSGLLMTYNVYLDFSAYSDLARGISKTLGIDIIINFKPFIFSTNPIAFWRCWHISLTTWIRDYLVLGTRNKKWSLFSKKLHILMVMIIVGIWHDFTWNWISFGLFHGMIIIGYQILKPRIDRICKASVMVGVFGFFFMQIVYVTSGLLHLAYGKEGFFIDIVQHSSTSLSYAFYLSKSIFYHISPAILPLLVFEYIQYKKNDYDFIVNARLLWKSLFVAYCLASIFIFERYSGSAFIYFDF